MKSTDQMATEIVEATASGNIVAVVLIGIGTWAVTAVGFDSALGLLNGECVRQNWPDLAAPVPGETPEPIFPTRFSFRADLIAGWLRA